MTNQPTIEEMHELIKRAWRLVASLESKWNLQVVHLGDDVMLSHGRPGGPGGRRYVEIWIDSPEGSETLYEEERLPGGTAESQWSNVEHVHRALDAMRKYQVLDDLASV